jgi:hypothetical protein
MAHRVAAWMTFGTAALVAAIVLRPSPVYSHKPITTSVLFKNEIAQIFQRKCFQCHSENNLGVSLTTYTEARPWARAIREEILERKMPPWTAVPGYGHFSNDIGLNAREMEIILSWTDGGAPSGVLKADESTPPVYVPPAPVWDHGTPDQVIPLGNGQAIDAGAPFEVKRFVVTTGFGAPKRVRAIALKQGDRRVVRHAAFYESGTGRWLGAWTPWQTTTTLPEGVAHRLPARAQIVVEIGYSGTTEAVIDKSELGLYFDTSSGPVVDTMSLRSADTPLPAGGAAHRVRAETKIATPMSVVALWPTPTDGARSIEVATTTPDGVVSPLLWIKEFRPDWRSPYVLSSPVSLPAGTRLTMTTYFENRSDKAIPARAQAWLAVVHEDKTMATKGTKTRGQ